MKYLVLVLTTIALCSVAQAGWWFFDDDDDMPRLSELMEPASLCIDQASDLADEGRVTESVQKYREALVEIDKIEAKYPDKLDQPEFATLKTKRAFVSAAIDAMLFNQARQNAKIVSTSDTTELEARLAKEKGLIKEKNPVKEKSIAKEKRPVKEKRLTTEKSLAKEKRPATPRERAMEAIAAQDFATADVVIAELLRENPKNPIALNLRAAKEASQGKVQDAERTLDQAIESNPRDYTAYYNMAHLYLQTRKTDKSAARRYYETGRIFGGPQDPDLEAALK